MIKTQLLCTFSTKKDIENNLDFIKKSYKLAYNYIYVLQNKNVPNDLFVTYNVVVEGQHPESELKTILVHRKKQTNTLYTINALNQLVMEKTGGMLDDKYEVDWEEYRNCILLTNGNDLRRLDTAIHKIVDFNR